MEEHEEQVLVQQPPEARVGLPVVRAPKAAVAGEGQLPPEARVAPQA